MEGTVDGGDIAATATEGGESEEAGTVVAVAVEVVGGATEGREGLSAMWVSGTKGAAGGEGIEGGWEGVAVEGAESEGGCSLPTTVGISEISDMEGTVDGGDIAATATESGESEEAGTVVAVAVVVVGGATEWGEGLSSMWVSDTKGAAGGEGIEGGGEG
eukprot:gene33546-43114_t